MNNLILDIFPPTMNELQSIDMELENESPAQESVTRKTGHAFYAVAEFIFYSVVVIIGFIAACIVLLQVLITVMVSLWNWADSTWPRQQPNEEIQNVYQIEPKQNTKAIQLAPNGREPQDRLEF